MIRLSQLRNRKFDIFPDRFEVCVLVNSVILLESDHTERIQGFFDFARNIRYEYQVEE